MGNINDNVFGNMEYNHRWVKTEKISFFNKTIDVIIAAKSYKEKPITDEQRESYKKFKAEIQTISDKAKTAVVDYLAKTGNKTISFETELNSILRLKTILFVQDGDVILLFDSSIDEENGIGIQVYPSIEVGPQNAFL